MMFVHEIILPCLTNPACGGFQYVRMLGQAEAVNLQGAKGGQGRCSAALGSCATSRYANHMCYSAAVAFTYMMLTNLAVVKQHMGLL